MYETTQPIEILLIEDNPGDIRLTREALKDAKIKNNLTVIEDGKDAYDYLLQKGAYKGAIKPDLILLDLNLPKMDGRELLQKIKSDTALRVIPVVVLTTSKHEEDILKSYDYHANCYINKPVDFNNLLTIVKSIEEFWFKIVKLPPRK